MLTKTERAQKLHAIVNAIVQHLPGWRLEAPPEDEYRAESWLKAGGPVPESEICFHANWRSYEPDNRISVSGTFPKSKLDSQAFGPRHGVDRPSATVAMDRPPAKLAADINRRVVVPYLILLGEAIQRRNAYDAARTAERGTAAHLAKVCNVELNGRNEFFPRGKVDAVSVSHYEGKERVGIKLRDLPASLAETIIRQVQAHEADELATHNQENT